MDDSGQKEALEKLKEFLRELPGLDETLASIGKLENLLHASSNPVDKEYQYYKGKYMLLAPLKGKAMEKIEHIEKGTVQNTQISSLEELRELSTVLDAVTSSPSQTSPSTNTGGS